MFLKRLSQVYFWSTFWKPLLIFTYIVIESSECVANMKNLAWKLIKKLNKLQLEFKRSLLSRRPVVLQGLPDLVYNTKLKMISSHDWFRSVHHLHSGGASNLLFRSPVSDHREPVEPWGLCLPEALGVPVGAPHPDPHVTSQQAVLALKNLMLP